MDYYKMIYAVFTFILSFYLPKQSTILREKFY